MWGWPARALRTVRRYAPANAAHWDSPPWIDIGNYKGVPTLPIFPGFLLNTLVYAAPWWLILITPGAIRRFRRRRRGRCNHCGYDLTGLGADDNTPPTCPECGA